MTYLQYGLDPAQLVRHVIRPITDTRLSLWSKSAEVLVLGTGLVESHLRFVDQVDKKHRPGPAFGLWQMEGPTHLDNYRNFLDFKNRRELKTRVLRLASHFSADYPDPSEMVLNIGYACAMCRIDYFRAREALPAWNDAAGMASYHKRYYNSAHGKTKTEESIKHFEFAIQLEDQL